MNLRIKNDKFLWKNKALILKNVYLKYAFKKFLFEDIINLGKKI